MNNIPWIIGYMNSAKPLLGQYIRTDSELHTAIQSKCKKLSFVPCKYNDYEQLQLIGSGFVGILFAFFDHNFGYSDDFTDESMIFKVFISDNVTGQNTEIYRKRIIIDEKHFLNLITSKNGLKYRNTRLLDIAKSLMPEI